jgi:DNA repair exonuclease SbcCD ATPase subunit
MIILKHLTIERFRLLRSMNLHFPQRGSILIQGPNEAGKSALIESIYFALYGEPLVTRRGNRSLNDLILYGAANATVSLTLSVGANELTVTRTIVRDLGQQVSLQIHQLGMPEEEPIVDLATVNAHIVAELGNLNGEALRNSGLIEQKGLIRLETISGSAREAAVQNLLGLDALTELSTRFQVNAEDEAQLALCSEHLHLAEIQARIPQLDARISQISASLDAVQMNEYLADIAQQEAEIVELEQTIEEIHSQRVALKARLSRVQQLKKADATLSEIIASYDDIAEARRELPLLEQQIADLERREREELPKIEKRVDELAELTRSFGTLERMSNDLLMAVDSIKELEQDLKEYNITQQELKTLEEQIVQAHERVVNVQRSLQDLEERRQIVRPQLESRVQRLNFLLERLHSLRSLENHYTERLASRSQAEENAQQLQSARKNVQEAEQELEIIESEARQVQQQADQLQRSWRQILMLHQLEEWHRLKGLSLGLSQAEQNVFQARQHQASITNSTMDARNTARKFMGYLVLCCIGLLIFLIMAFYTLASVPFIAIIAFIVAVVLIGVGLYNLQNYRKARIQENTLKVQEQEAISRVGMMVAAREAALRMGGNDESLRQVENEIRSLDGRIPQSLEEAQQILNNTRDQSDPGDLQQRMQSKLVEAKEAQDQVNVTRESVTSLQNELHRLEALRTREKWDSIEEDLTSDQASIELLHQEITLLASQENLPLPSINARIRLSPIPASQSLDLGQLAPVEESDDVTGVPALEDLVESTIKATEHEIISLDSKLDMVTDLTNQSRGHQEHLDTLRERQRILLERTSRYQTSSPEVQVERAREQQMELRSALQSLQDSLRQRVKPLGVAFGQAAIGSAESSARKQLEELNITLGNKIMLQERHRHYTDVLKDRQLSLSEHYKQLAKFSNTLGSWIVPLNPFAEALVALRSRCQNDIQEADEGGLVQQLDDLKDYEDASRMKIQLCDEEIHNDEDAISSLFQLCALSLPVGFARTDLVAAWPLLDEYQVEDRQRLEDEDVAVKQELSELKQQEAALRESLSIGDITLDLEETQTRMAQQERSYEIKKHGHQLLQETRIRLLNKIQPRTAHYMQQILPLLTGGRYHEVQLITEPEENTVSGGPFQIQVWDSTAGEYVPASALSGGAADQLSLALRLAFAIATLPRDLNIAPGFVLLDEPLSSFDRGRAQALVDVVTGDVLSQHFEQIILLSHSSAFDPALFPYHVYIDNGLVVDSNLPVVPALPVPAAIDPYTVPVTPFPIPMDEDEDEEEDATVAIAVVKVPGKK